MTRVGDALRPVGTLFGLGFRAAPGWMVASLALLGASGLASVAPSFGSQLLIDGVVADDTRRVVTAVVLIGVTCTFFWASGIVAAALGAGLRDRVAMEVSAEIAELATGAPGVEHYERPDYLRELELLEQHRGMLGSGPRQCVFLVRAVLQLAATVVLLATVHPALALLPALGAFPFVAQRRSVAMRQRSDEDLAEQRRLATALFTLGTQAGTASELRTYGLADELVRRHRELTDAVTAATTRVAVRGAALDAVAWTLFATGLVGGLTLVLHEAAAGRVSTGEVLMAVGLAQLTQWQLADVSSLAGQVVTTTRTVRRYLWLHEHTRAPARSSGAAPQAVPERLASGIRLDGVTFRYPGTDVDVLAEVTFELPAGATVALVGENGAGKTTLVKLLCGMYTPSAGTIRVDGTDLDDLELAAWRLRTSAAFQDATRYELTAGQNVGIGDLPRIDHEVGVTDALHHAGAEGLLAQLDHGLATPLGRSLHGGRELSGGQWQQLALGRAMMRPDPLLLVLDEPTASLDAVVEHQLYQRYQAAARQVAEGNGAITLLVSHRLASVRTADLIVVLEAGRVVESGTHAELVVLGGAYAELHELQAHAYR